MAHLSFKRNLMLAGFLPLLAVCDDSDGSGGTNMADGGVDSDLGVGGGDAAATPDGGSDAAATPDGGSDAATDAFSMNPTSAMIGSGGGKLPLPGGGELVVPANALTADTVLSVRIVPETTSGLPAVPDWGDATGAIFEITPHDLRLAGEVTLSIPTNGSVLLHAAPDGEWEPIFRIVRQGGNLVAQVASFSFFRSLKIPCGKGEAQSLALQRAFLDILAPAQQCSNTCSSLLRLPEVELENACVAVAGGIGANLLSAWYTKVDFDRLLPDGCIPAAFEVYLCSDGQPACAGGQCTLAGGNGAPHSAINFVTVRARNFVCGEPNLNNGSMVYLYNAHKTEAVTVTVDITQTSAVNPTPTTITVDTLVPPLEERPIAYPSYHLSCTSPAFGAGRHQHAIKAAAFTQ